MANPNGVRAGAAFIELTLTDKVTKGLQDASKRLREFGAGVGQVGVAVSAVGVVLSAPFVAGARAFAQTGSAVTDLSRRLGIGAEAVTSFGYAAKQSGTDIDTVEKGLIKIQKETAEAADGNKEAAKTLGLLGLSFRDLQGLAPEDQFRRVAQQVSAIQDPAQRTRAAMELFGRSGQMLIPMMADLAALENEAKSLGLTMTATQAAGGDALGDAFDRVAATANMASVAIGQALAPTIINIADQIARVLADTKKWIGENEALVQTFAKVAAGITAIGAALGTTGAAIIGAGYVLGGLGKAAGVTLAAMKTFAAAFQLARIGAWTSGISAGAQALGPMSTALGVAQKAAAALNLQLSLMTLGGMKGFIASVKYMTMAAAAAVAPYALLGATIAALGYLVYKAYNYLSDTSAIESASKETEKLTESIKDANKAIERLNSIKPFSASDAKKEVQAYISELARLGKSDEEIRSAIQGEVNRTEQAKRQAYSETSAYNRNVQETMRKDAETLNAALRDGMSANLADFRKTEQAKLAEHDKEIKKIREALEAEVKAMGERRRDLEDRRQEGAKDKALQEAIETDPNEAFEDAIDERNRLSQEAAKAEIALQAAVEEARAKPSKAANEAVKAAEESYLKAEEAVDKQSARIEQAQRANEEAIRRGSEEEARIAEELGQERDQINENVRRQVEDKARHEAEEAAQAAAEEELSNKAEVSGTFSSAALGMMGYGGVQERTAKATEATAKNTKATLEAIDDLDLAFGT